MKKSIGQELVDEVSQFRKEISERVDRVNSLTESEVMSAVDALSNIVDVVSTLNDQTNKTLRGISGSEDTSQDQHLTMAIAKQSDETENFVALLQARMDEQRTAATKAHEQSQAIQHAANSVESLSHQAKILAINAMIEAGRMGESGAAFTVIGHEMQWLSNEIKRTNMEVAQLAENLGKLLPSIAAMIEKTAVSTESFATSINDTIADVRFQTGTLQNGVEGLLAQNNTALSAILIESNEALSHLQFQDTVAQGLMRLDSIARDLVVTVGTLSGEDMSSMTLPTETHHELGGDKEISPDTAGDVMLF